MDYRKEYERWCSQATADTDVAAELQTMDDAKVEDAFYRDLAFGTGGTVMISSLFRQTLEQEQQMALQENRYLCFSFQNTVQSMGSYQTFDPQTVLGQMENLTGTRNSEFSITENVKKIRSYLISS